MVEGDKFAGSKGERKLPAVVNNSLDIAKAKQLWPGLEPVLSEAVSRAYQSVNGRNIPASFGFGSQRQSRSLVKPEETTIETVDAVLRDTFYEEESHREVV